MCVDLLNGFARAHRDRGPQGRMAIHKRLKRASENGDVYIGADARRKTDIVNRAFRRELAQKPDPLLVIGERIKRFGLAHLFLQELREKTALFIRGKIGCSLGGLAHSMTFSAANISVSSESTFSSES